MSDDDRPPVECTLTAEQAAERSDEVWSTLADTYRDAEELADGYTIRFEGTDEALLAAAEFVSNELRCCSFADYRIDVAPPYEETRLTVTGPEQTKSTMGPGFVEELAGAD
jgi:hypothetical protein